VALPNVIDTWEHTSSCGTASPPAADVARWAADSVVSATADYAYAQTVVDFFDCATMSNGTAGGAYFFAQAITTPHSVSCFTQCSGEPLGNAGVAAELTAMNSNCVPRH
jgi:hypothetical protein